MKLNSHFDAELKSLQLSLENMMSVTHESLRTIAEVLSERDPEKIERIRSLSQELDQAERTIESLCLRILLTRHPVASDLRRVSATLKMITDLQRIGHQSRDFADILVDDGNAIKSFLPRLKEIAAKIVEMFEGAIAACAHEDAAVARTVATSDNEIDAEYRSLRLALAVEMANPPIKGSDRLLDVLMLGKYLERMADHIVMFSRWVIFSSGVEEEEMSEDEDIDDFR